MPAQGTNEASGQKGSAKDAFNMAQQLKDCDISSRDGGVDVFATFIDALIEDFSPEVSKAKNRDGLTPASVALQGMADAVFKCTNSEKDACVAMLRAQTYADNKKVPNQGWQGKLDRSQSASGIAGV